MSHGIRPVGFKVKIKEALCVGCRKCFHVCPRRNIREGGDGKAEVVDPLNCNGCSKCVAECLTKAISVSAAAFQSPKK